MTIAILTSFSGQGGVERMVLNLLGELARRGVPTDLVVTRRDTLPQASLPAGIRLFDLGVRHSLLAVLPLALYLRRRAPAALLAAKDRAIRAALLARRLGGARTRVVGRLGTHLSESLRHRSGAARWLRVRPMRALYRDIDLLVGISQGVVDDAQRLTGLPASRLRVIPNPVVTPELLRRGADEVREPWLAEPTPVVLGVGRLTRQKDFATLVRAFAIVQAARPCRLLLVGEGEERDALTGLIGALGLADTVRLVGYQDNPYAYMTRASVVVLSSLWEGLGNVLVEALALGTPVVATDCPSGPAEVLEGGRYGRLVRPGDARELAAAILETLADPLPRALLREAAAPYAVEHSAGEYLRALGLPVPAGG